MKIITSTLTIIALIINVNLHAQAWQPQDPNFLYKTTPYDVICPNTSDAWTFGFEYDSSFTSFSQVNYTLSRTTDSGQTWESIEFPHTEPGYFSHLSALSGDVAWISYVDYTEGNKVLQTTDGGLNWTNANPGGALQTGFSTFSWYFGQVRVHPTDPNTVYVLDFLLMKL